MPKGERNIDQIFDETDDFIFDNPEDICEEAELIINLDEINAEAKKMASMITERLSNYYFDEKYIENHPYIPTKIMNEMDNIRRLLKMLSVNEKAQDALIANITFNAGKGALYTSLTSLQNSMLSIQNQLNNLTSSLENIFQEMQAECEKTFAEKDKEETDDGSVIVRGAREFIEKLNKKLYGEKDKSVANINVDIETGEVLNEASV